MERLVCSIIHGPPLYMKVARWFEHSNWHTANRQVCPVILSYIEFTTMWYKNTKMP